MKTRLNVLTFSLVFLTSCASISSFDSPNNLSQMKSTLHLKDGRSVSGYLSINTENRKNDKVRIQSANYSKPLFFKLKNIKGYSIGDDHFLLKEIENTTIVIERGNSLIEQLLTKKKYYFMKRLTPADSRMHLYENEYIKQPYGNSTTASRIIVYYIQLPHDSSNKVYAIEGKKLVPHFEAKMSAFVSDCPILATKIAQKHPGYYYAPLSLPILSQTNSADIVNGVHTGIGVVNDRNAAILLQIIHEFNQCK